MSESFILKKQCERCPAADEVQVSAEDIKSGKYTPAKSDGAPRVEIKVDGKVLCTYRRLCANCEVAVMKAVTDVAKKREKKSSTRS